MSELLRPRIAKFSFSFEEQSISCSAKIDGAGELVLLHLDISFYM